jgi:hypothetical protein
MDFPEVVLSEPFVYVLNIKLEIRYVKKNKLSDKN